MTRCTGAPGSSPLPARWTDAIFLRNGSLRDFAGARAGGWRSARNVFHWQAAAEVWRIVRRVTTKVASSLQRPRRPRTTVPIERFFKRCSRHLHRYHCMPAATVVTQAETNGQWNPPRLLADSTARVGTGREHPHILFQTLSAV